MNSQQYCLRRAHCAPQQRWSPVIVAKPGPTGQEAPRVWPDQWRWRVPPWERARGSPSVEYRTARWLRGPGASSLSVFAPVPGSRRRRRSSVAAMSQHRPRTTSTYTATASGRVAAPCTAIAARTKRPAPIASSRYRNVRRTVRTSRPLFRFREVNGRPPRSVTGRSSQIDRATMGASIGLGAFSPPEPHRHIRLSANPQRAGPRPPRHRARLTSRRSRCPEHCRPSRSCPGRRASSPHIRILGCQQAILMTWTDAK